VPTAGRVARNESLFREVNERIVELEQQLGERGSDTGMIGFVCECASVGCTTRVEANLAEYRTARKQPTRFLVAPSHVDPDHERVVTTNNRFAIVEKLGLAGEVATDEAD
jgi:hypothetical protein